MGSPNQLTRQQVASLQTAASGAPLETRTITIRNGAFEHEFEMHENDTVLVILKRQ
jgi:beta-xylosidase